MATRQREKSAKNKKNRDKRPYAEAKYIRIPSGKVEIVLDLIRGKGYEQAIAILNNTNKSASPVILKVLTSAGANAENNLNIAKDNLFVAECWAGPGPTLKRMMPRARGRADRILKRTTHIKVILDERKVEKQKSEGTMKKPTATDTKAKPQPKIDQERPIAKTPNTKKPLGEKKTPINSDVKKVTTRTTTRTTQAKKDGGKK